MSQSSGVAYKAPFTGGFNVPRAQLADIDGDGDADLFLHEGGNAFHFLETVQSGQSPLLRWHGRQWMGLETGDWARLGDVDRDGDLDLLCESRFGRVRIYRNKGTDTVPAFEKMTDALLDVNGDTLLVTRDSPFDLFDIDCDGDLDWILTRADSALLVRKHTGLDDRGLPVFGPEASLPIQRPAAKRTAGAAVQHALANYFALTDLDGDGDPDLLWSSMNGRSLERVENRGITCSEPVMVATGEGFPAASPIAGAGPVLVQVADFDGDGDEDLFNVIPEDDFDPTLGEPFAEVELYRNTGTAGAPAFLLETPALIGNVDIGNNAYPALADLDGDGDLDLALFGQTHLDLQQNRVVFFRNAGNAQAPDFRQDTSVVLPRGESTFPAPAFADLDADGDQDLLLGGLFQGIYLFRNQGSAAIPDFRLEDTLFAGHEGTTPAPAFADIDGDGDADLLVAEYTGELVFYRNHGNPAQPDFRPEVFPLDKLPDASATLTFADLDGDGDLDFAAGTRSGRIYFYENTGNAAEPALRLGGIISREANFRPVLADLDGDGDADLLGGTGYGGLIYLENLGQGQNIWRAFEEAGLSIRSGRQAFSPGTSPPGGRWLARPVPGRLPAGLEIRDLLGRRLAPSRRTGVSADGQPGGAVYAPAGVYWIAPARRFDKRADPGPPQ